MTSEDGAVEIGVPRDRSGSFEPQLVKKGQTRIDGFDDQIISMYACGMSVREIQGHLNELYGVAVSPDLISRVTDVVLEDVKAWQNRGAEDHLGKFEEKWDEQYPSIGQSWRRNWAQVIPFFAFPKDVRRIIYTTNAIESLNASIRKIIKSRGQLPNDDAAIKLIYLAIQNAGQVSNAGVWGWKTALNQFAIMFEDRMTNQI